MQKSPGMRTAVLAVLLCTSAAAFAGKPGRTMTRRVQIGDVITSPTFGAMHTAWKPISKGSAEAIATPSFGKAMFVVEQAMMASGGHDTLGPIPAGWKVVARKLKPDGSYDRKGRTITFFQSANHTPDVSPGEITLVKRLRLSFTDAH